MLLDAQTTHGKLCPEQTKSSSEAEELSQQNNDNI